MKLFVPLYLFYLFGLNGRAKADLFTAMVSLEPLANAENAALDRISEYIQLEMDRIEHLRRIGKQYQEEYEKKIKAKELALNPINSFRLLKSVTTDWEEVMGFINSRQSVENFLNNVTVWPSDEDLKGAAEAIFRIQDVYRLTTTDLVSGRVAGSSDLFKMTAKDAFELGRQASFSRDDYHAILWLNEALSRVRQEMVPTVDEADILDFLQFSLYQQGNTLAAYKAVKRLAFMRPYDERAKDNVKFYTSDLREAGISLNSQPPELTNPRPPDYDEEETGEYEALCRGEYKQKESELKKLYCYYKNDHSFLKYAPIKVEILHFHPFVAIFRQVLSNRETSIIKDLATPKLQRATVFNRKTRELEHANYRITKSAWLKSEDHEVISRINDRLGHMTNLDQSTAELFQVANYGLGGHYSPHFDHSTKDDANPFRDGNGNRIATVLFYLNAPLAGGATVFVNLKLTLFPQRNDALFWYNLLPNGQGDDRTRHAACPVLAGTKWVSNKWIHERAQEFKRPCKKNYDDETYFIDYHS